MPFIQDVIKKIKNREIKCIKDLEFWQKTHTEFQFPDLFSVVKRSTILISAPYSTELEEFSSKDFKVCFIFLGIETLKELESISKEAIDVLNLKGLLYSVGLRRQ